MSNSAIPTWVKDADWELTDPADAGAIDNTLTGIVPLVSVGAAETRTLAAPLKHGLVLVLNMMTYGGDIVVTVGAPGYDEAGNTLLTFNNMGEWCMLLSMRSATSTYAWRIVAYDGVIGPGVVIDDLTVTDLIVTTVTASDLSALEDITGSGTLVMSGATTTAGITDSGTIAATIVTVSGTLGITGATTSASITASGAFSGTSGTFSTTLGITGATTAAAITASGLVTASAGANIDGDLTLIDGGTVAQLTSTVTGVTLNTHSGQITTFASTLAAGGEESFTVTNSVVTALDTISMTANNGTNTGGTPIAFSRSAAAGSFVVVVSNLHASTSLNGTLVVNYNVISGASS